MPWDTSNPEETLKNISAGIQKLLANAKRKKLMLESGTSEASQDYGEYMSLMETFQQREEQIIDKCEQLKGELNKTPSSVIGNAFENVPTLCSYCQNQLELLIKATNENIAIAKKNVTMRQSSTEPSSGQSGQTKPVLKRTKRYRNLAGWLNSNESKTEGETLRYKSDLLKDR